MNDGESTQQKKISRARAVGETVCYAKQINEEEVNEEEEDEVKEEEQKSIERDNKKAKTE